MLLHSNYYSMCVCVWVREGEEERGGFSGWKLWAWDVNSDGRSSSIHAESNTFIHYRLLDHFWPQCYSHVSEIKEKLPKPHCVDSSNLRPVCPLPAPVPIWGAKEAAITGHRTDHLTGQQLVSALSINTLILALWLINNQLSCRV